MQRLDFFFFYAFVSCLNYCYNTYCYLRKKKNLVSTMFETERQSVYPLHDHSMISLYILLKHIWGSWYASKSVAAERDNYWSTTTVLLKEALQLLLSYMLRATLLLGKIAAGLIANFFYFWSLMSLVTIRETNFKC